MSSVFDDASQNIELTSAAEEQRVSCQRISNFLENNFTSLDTNIDQFVTESELTKFVLNKHTSNSDYKVALAARDLSGSLESLHWELGGIAHQGFSLADVHKFNQLTTDDPDTHLARQAHYAMLKDEHDSDRFFALVNDNRPQIDVNQDGLFSRSELEDFANDTANKSDARGASEFMLKKSKEIQRLGSVHSLEFTHGGNFRSDPDRTGISEKHLHNLQLLRIDAKEFTDKMNQCRGNEVKLGLMLGAAGALGATACIWQSGMRTGFGRAGFIAGAAIGAGMAVWSAYHVAVNHSKPLINDYLDQRQRVNSWKYFTS